jgi:hypothetical protein
MRKIIKKEFQENVAGAVMGVLIYSVMLVIVHRGLQQTLSGEPIFNLEYLQSVSVFVCVLLGLSLGGKQTHADLQRDLMAFLVHRPLSQSRIFVARTIAGLSMYTAVTVAPLLVYSVFESNKHPEEFRWSMLLTLTTAWLCGVMCYFVAVLTTLRKARWYATKLAAIIFGGTVFFAAFKGNPFQNGLTSANLLLLLGALILATASLGSFLGNGEQKGQPVLSQAALTFVIAVYCAMTIYFIVASTYMVSRVWVNRETQDSVMSMVEALFVPLLSFVIDEQALNPTKIILKLAVAVIIVIPMGVSVAYRYRLGLLRQIGWAVFYLCFGLPGFLAFLAVHDWPQLVKCSKCRKDRAVDREQCPQCGAGFESPAETGIEIFEKITLRA